MAAYSARFRLSPDENERIFRNEIVPARFADCRPQTRPVVIFIGGQTGAGKTAVTAMVTRSLAQRDGYVNANMDFFSPYHPHYEGLRRDDEATASAYIRPDVETWWNKTQQYAIDQRYNVVIESAMRSPAEFEDLMPPFREAGYQVEVALLAVPESLSRLGILDRYCSEVRLVGHGRLIDPAVHDECYRGVVRGAAAIDQTDLVDHVFVFRRDGHVTYSNSRDEHGQWVHPPATANAVATERSRRWTPEESTWFRTSVDKLRHDIDPRSHGALDQVRALASRLLPQLPAESSISAARTTPRPGQSGPPVEPISDGTKRGSRLPRTRGEAPTKGSRSER